MRRLKRRGQGSKKAGSRPYSTLDSRCSFRNRLEEQGGAGLRQALISACNQASISDFKKFPKIFRHTLDTPATTCA